MLASAIPMLLQVFINPMIALNMSPEDYAIVGYYTAFSTLFAPVVTFYLSHYYTKRFFELSERQRQTLKSTIVLCLVTFSFAVAAVLLFGLYGYNELFNAKSKIEFLPYAPLAVFALPLTGIYSLTLVEYRMSRDSRKFFNLSVFNGLLLAGTTMLLVVLFKFGAIGKLSATISASLVVFVLCLYLNRSSFRYGFDWNVFRKSVKFCFPLVLAAMLGFFSGGYDKVILERTGDLNGLGIYVVGVSIASYLNLFTTSINDTFQPDIFQSIAQKNYRKCLKIISIKVGFISAIVLIFMLCAPLLINILTAGRYINSSPFAMIVSLSSISSMLYYSFSQVVISLGYTKIVFLNRLLGSAVCIGIYWFLINAYGPYGAAWGLVASFMVFFLGLVIQFLIVHSFFRKSTKTK